MVVRKRSRREFEQSIVHFSATLEEVIPHMECEVALIVDDDGRLCGLITDGDLRRAFLAGATMSSPVAKVMTINPLALRKKPSRKEVFSIMMKRQVRHLPVIDADGRPVGLEFLRDQYDDDDIDAAVLMAGGKGVRLRPLTENTPKPLLRVGEDTIIDSVLRGLKSGGVSDVAIAINYLGEKIKDHVKNGEAHQMSVNYLEEKKALGTAGALSLLRPRPKNAFIVMNADLLTEVDYKALSRFHKREGNDLSVCVRKVRNVVPFGVVSLRGDDSLVEDVVEKPEHEYLANAGIYMLEPKIVGLVPKNTFFDMVSLIKKALRHGCKVGAFPVFEYWRDVGQHHEMRAAEIDMKRKKLAEMAGKNMKIAGANGGGARCIQAESLI